MVQVCQAVHVQDNLVKSAHTLANLYQHVSLCFESQATVLRCHLNDFNGAPVGTGNYKRIDPFISPVVFMAK